MTEPHAVQLDGEPIHLESEDDERRLHAIVRQSVQVGFDYGHKAGFRAGAEAGMEEGLAEGLSHGATAPIGVVLDALLKVRRGPRVVRRIVRDEQGRPSALIEEPE